MRNVRCVRAEKNTKSVVVVRRRGLDVFFYTSRKKKKGYYDINYKDEDALYVAHSLFTMGEINSAAPTLQAISMTKIHCQ